MADSPSPESGIGRLFFPEAIDLESIAGRNRCLEIVLEQGDSSDLRQILPQIGESQALDWFRHHGGRRLSRRSRLFWAFLLDCPLPEPHPLTEEIWPL